MPGKEMLEKMFAYDTQVNERILEHASKLEHEQYHASTGISHGSLHGLLVHMLRAAWVWRMLCQARELPSPPPYSLETIAEIDVLRVHWNEENRLLHEYLASLDEGALAASVRERKRGGEICQLIRWQMLVHLFLHNMQHRTEAAMILTQYGSSPGDLDFIFYL